MQVYGARNVLMLLRKDIRFEWKRKQMLMHVYGARNVLMLLVEDFCVKRERKQMDGCVVDGKVVGRWNVSVRLLSKVWLVGVLGKVWLTEPTVLLSKE